MACPLPRIAPIDGIIAARRDAIFSLRDSRRRPINLIRFPWTSPRAMAHVHEQTVGAIRWYLSANSAGSRSGRLTKDRNASCDLQISFKTSAYADPRGGVKPDEAHPRGRRPGCQSSRHAGRRFYSQTHRPAITRTSVHGGLHAQDRNHTHHPRCSFSVGFRSARPVRRRLMVCVLRQWFRRHELRLPLVRAMPGCNLRQWREVLAQSMVQ